MGQKPRGHPSFWPFGTGHNKPIPLLEHRPRARGTLRAGKRAAWNTFPRPGFAEWSFDCAPHVLGPLEPGLYALRISPQGSARSPLWQYFLVMPDSLQTLPLGLGGNETRAEGDE